MTEVIRIAMVEDDPIIRETVSLLISGSPGFASAGLYEDGEAALAEIPKTHPDVILLDIRMPRVNGIECLRQLRQRGVKSLVIIFTMFDDDDLVFQALEAGASGYLLKRASSAEILGAIMDVVKGGSPMSPSIARKVVRSFHKPAPAGAPDEQLSAREEQVVRLLSEGRSYKEVAEQMGIRLDTVRSHIRNVYSKLEVHSAAAAVSRLLGRKNDPPRQ